MPVQYGSEEDGLIFGYRKAGAEWFAFHPMHEGGGKAFVETEWPWTVVVYGPGRTQPPAAKELAPSAIEQAVCMAHTAEAGAYHLGFTAWRAYIDRLRCLATATPGERAGDMMGNAWIYECLVGFRASAATYLETIAPEFPTGVATHLRVAARLYEEVACRVLCDETHTPDAIAPYPWSLNKGMTWLDTGLGDQIERLEAAIPVERSAIAALEAALAQIDANA